MIMINEDSEATKVMSVFRLLIISKTPTLKTSITECENVNKINHTAFGRQKKCTKKITMHNIFNMCRHAIISSSRLVTGKGFPFAFRDPEIGLA